MWYACSDLVATRGTSRVWRGEEWKRMRSMGGSGQVLLLVAVTCSRNSLWWLLSLSFKEDGRLFGLLR